MRILVANSFVGSGAGGQERVALDLGIGLNKMGHNVWLLGPYSHCEDLRRRIPDCIMLSEQPWANRSPGQETAAGLFRAAFRLIRRQRIDLVSGHGRMFGVWLACRLTGVPLVWTLHGVSTALVRRRRLDLRRLAVQAAFRRISQEKRTRLVAVSEFTRVCALEMLQQESNGNVKVIRNGVAALPLLCSMPVPTFTGRLRLGYVGRFEGFKGVFDFAPLCQRLTDLGVPFSLSIYGNGSEEAGLRRALAGWTKSGVVSFCGYQGDVWKIYSSFDILVHPARAEWLGTSLIESQAAARVPIAYRSGGTPEIITHSVSGFTLPVGDVEGIASAIESLYKNPALAVETALNARERAQVNFSLERMCKGYESLFQELV